jgi:Transposase zinc-ribbon domain
LYIPTLSAILKLVGLEEEQMANEAREVLAEIATVTDMTAAFADEERCRRLLEAMVWPRGRICPACGYKGSIALAGRDVGRRARPGLYQCSNGECRF